MGWVWNRHLYYFNEQLVKLNPPQMPPSKFMPGASQNRHGGPERAAHTRKLLGAHTIRTSAKLTHVIAFWPPIKSASH